MSSGAVNVKTGSYDIDAQTWFDIRLTDLGLSISLCDNEMNTRYTVVIDDGKVAFGEAAKLMRDEEDGQDPYTKPGYEND
jgi:hypothetical protein